MPIPLDEWQLRLEQHFTVLAEQRANSGFPIFALEHGLSEPELNEISVQLIKRLGARRRLTPHWLLWTIYAAESGYTYEGGEYWQSFEESTPGWNPNDRSRFSSWFSNFQKSYRGVLPSGPWAEHFRIIAWPITHAILPKYLQKQFARTMYDLRYKLAQLNSIEPGAIGRMIAANVYHTTTRFDEFLQQEELVGRMVLALLHRDPREGEEPLLPATLNRIVSDLEGARHARSWLDETSRVVTDRFKGLGRGDAPTDIANDLRSGGRHPGEPRPGIRPNVRLPYIGNHQWRLVIDIPSFREVAALDSDMRRFLQKARCILDGGSKKKPAGWVLSGTRRAVLKKWPDPQTPLVMFEGTNAALEHLLESECQMSKGPIWLFRVGRDGTAREIISRLVRPGLDYILTSHEPIEDLLDGMNTCSLDCENITAIRMSVPSDVPAEYLHWLRNRNLELARTIRVWPAGLPGRNWDGEGHSEWLTTEKPCFGIVHDHPVDSYTVTLNNECHTTIDAGAVGFPTFIQVPRLRSGTHVLKVKAQRHTSLDDLGAPPAHEGYLELHVRDPEPWMPGTASHAGLVVFKDPHDAALDMLWENELALTVFGPENRQVTPFVSLECPSSYKLEHIAA